MCVQVCVCVGEGGSLQENTEILLIQSVCGGEEIRVKKMNTLAPHHCSYYKKKPPKQTEMHRKREKGEKVFVSQETLHVLGQLVL